MSSYWTNRIKAFEKAYKALGDKAINKTELAMKREYRRISDRLIAELEAMYDKLIIEAQDGKPLISHLYQYNKYYEMLGKIEKELLVLGDRQNRTLSRSLEDMYEKNTKLVGESFNLGTSINPERVQEVISQTWVDGGVHWSQSIWNNQAKLTETIREGIIDCVSTGKTTDDFTKMLMGRFNVSYREANRLARTELMHVQNQSALDKYKEAGIEEYEILVADDERTCDECMEMDGKIFKMSEQEPGINYPPFHPNCRCTVLAVIK